GRRNDGALRLARDRRADRGSVGVRARGRRLLRGDGVEPHPDSGGEALLHVRAVGGAAAAAGEAARARAGGLARAGLARVLPRSRRARGDADRADREADAAHRRPHVTPFGLGLQTDKPPGSYAPLARAAEEAGFAVVTAFNDLW